MKYIQIFFWLILTSVAAWAQETGSNARDISLKILNRRDRPVRNVVVQSINANIAGITDRKGMFVFKDLTDKDSILVMLPNFGKTIIPVAGLDSIVVTIRSKQLYSFVNNEGKKVVFARDITKTQPNVLMDVPAMLEQHSYTSLYDLLLGKVPGLSMSRQSEDRSTAVIRGVGTTGSNEPLIVVNGMAIGSFNDANNTINVRDIKTIEVQKSGSEWGMRGANGVILITTK